MDKEAVQRLRVRYLGELERAQAKVAIIAAKIEVLDELAVEPASSTPPPATTN